jgi:hypothetical protein
LPFNEIPHGLPICNEEATLRHDEKEGVFAT